MAAAKKKPTTKPTRTPSKATTAKRKAIAPKKRAAAKKGTAATRRDAAADGVFDAALFPTARAYAEEELHLLSVARKDPSLGERFVADATRRVETTIPKKHRTAFLAAMKKVDVEARARVVVAKMEKYWGVPLDEETRESVKDDVRSMYAGK